MASQQAGRLCPTPWPLERVLGRAGEGRPSPRGSASGSDGSAGDGSGSPMMIRQHVSHYIQARTAGLCPASNARIGHHPATGLAAWSCRSRTEKRYASANRASQPAPAFNIGYGNAGPSIAATAWATVDGSGNVVR